MRKFAISDIHGCRQTFDALLQKIELKKEDKLFLLGDFIDRGPDAKGVLDKVMTMQEEGYQVHCTWGNHEEIMMDIITNPVNLGSWLRSGGASTLTSFEVNYPTDIPSKYIDFIRSFPHYLEEDQYILVHAGLNFKLRQPLKGLTDMLWIRKWYDSINYKWLKDRMIIHGHTPQTTAEILELKNNLADKQVINIDNGCFVQELPGKGFLCAFEMTGQELFFQKNIDYSNTAITQKN